MTTHIGLLRAVNLPGHNKVGMADLCRMLSELGLKDARSLLQSGNVVFRDDRRSSLELETFLEAAAKKRLGLETDFFVRSASDWATMIAANPFPKEAEGDPSHLLVMFLKKEPERDSVPALQKSIKGREIVKAKGRHAYIVYPDGVGRSRLTNTVIEKAFGTSVTGRNWNTVLKLATLTHVE
jgi:uncharacterized protein (DUF1697 family)